MIELLVGLAVLSTFCALAWAIGGRVYRWKYPNSEYEPTERISYGVIVIVLVGFLLVIAWGVGHIVRGAFYL